MCHRMCCSLLVKADQDNVVRMLDGAPLNAESAARVVACVEAMAGVYDPAALVAAAKLLLLVSQQAAAMPEAGWCGAWRPLMKAIVRMEEALL